MSFSARKVVRTYALVTNGWMQFRVFPDGGIMMWSDAMEDWSWYPDYEDYHDEVLKTGLEVLSETN